MKLTVSTQRWLFFVALTLTASLGSVTLSHTARAAQATTTPTLQGDPSHPPQTTNWVEPPLYFGIGPTNKPAPEAAWRSFLDHEVTPRFPSGLSVVDVYGQWQGKQQTAPEREHSKLLIIDYPATPDNAARIEAIRTAWKQRTHAQSVLKVTQPADVSF